jgi:hypothetical protein
MNCRRSGPGAEASKVKRHCGPVAAGSQGRRFRTLPAEADGSVNLDELDGVDTDLVIRPFSQKGVMTSLRQFTINALNQHHGMQADERFGAALDRIGRF